MIASRDEFKALEKIPSREGIFHPRTTDEVKEIINFAKTKNFLVRTIGSAHSPQPAIYDKECKNQIKIILDGELKKIKSTVIDDSKEFAIVSVNAGCHLGKNPADVTSTLENSFNFQIDKIGYALPNLGGISHQTIAGFIQTSSSGGSAKHNIADAIEAIEWINGKGELCHAKKGEAEYDAVGVSMGLFGIITNVTFKLSKKYLVAGVDENKEFKDSVLVTDSKEHHAELDKMLFENEYAHINWLPQPGVNRTMQWSGKSVAASSPVVPYVHSLSSGFKTLLAVAVLHIGNLINIFGKDSKELQQFLAFLLKQFADPNDRQEFCDVWYKTLPIDDQAQVDGSVKTLFSELWFPRDQMDEVMHRLNKLFSAHPEAAGNFIVELYSAKQSPFMLSPSYGHDVFRVDLYWWVYNIGDPNKYFGMFWDALLDIPGAKLHWGKYLPIPGEKYGEKVFTAEQLYQSYPKFSEWNELRNQHDPQQLFVTDYWRRVLNIPTLQKISELEEKAIPAAVFSSDTLATRFLQYFGLYGSTVSSELGNKKAAASVNELEQPLSGISKKLN